MKAFGVYAAVTGVGLLLAPALVLAPLGLPAPTEFWIRVLGALAIVIGYYYWACGAAGATAFARASVKGRMAFAALCVVLVVTGMAPMQLLLLAAIDVLGAIWTARALRQVPA